MQKNSGRYNSYIHVAIGFLAALSISPISNTFAQVAKLQKKTPTTTMQPKQEVFGTNVATLSLNNFAIGEKGYTTHAYRFRASQSGSLSAIRAYFIYKFSKAGYHTGTGGVIRVSIRPDDGSTSHLPSSTILTSTDVKMNLCSPEEVTAAGTRLDGPCGYKGQLNRDGVRMTFAPIEFKPGTDLQKGSLYHVVFENIDPDPIANSVSVNGLFHPGGIGRLLNNLPPPNGLTLLSRDRTTKWVESKDTIPILSIMLNGGEKNKANGGSEFGLGYVQPWAAWNSIPAVSKTVFARQTFTTDRRRRFSEVNLHLGHIQGDGSVSIEIRDAKGRIRRSIDVSSRKFPSFNSCPWRSYFGSATGTPNKSCGIWVQRAISPPLIANPGERYSLIVRGNGAARFEMYLLQKGLAYNFGKATLFNAGSADMSSDGGLTWKPWVIWEEKRSDADLQFYLR